MNIVRYPGELDWYGVDLDDNTLCRKRDGEPLTVIARFSNSVEANRFKDMLERVADLPVPVRATRPTRFWEGWGLG